VSGEVQTNRQRGGRIGGKHGVSTAGATWRSQRIGRGGGGGRLFDLRRGGQWEEHCINKRIRKLLRGGPAYLPRIRKDDQVFYSKRGGVRTGKGFEFSRTVG